MDGVRYAIALLLVVVFPAGMSMWFVIHPLAGFWRRQRPLADYSAVLVVAIAIAASLFASREKLLAVDFGFSWVLTAIGVGCAALSIGLERKYRREIKVSTLLGLPEVSASQQGELLTGGVYSRVRHPRYVGLVLEISAFALFANYLAGYVVVLVTLPGLFAIVQLEERELLRRFGEDYAQYRRRVPRFVPRSWWPIWRR
jgi:protein-S-isoprenylcysteine O-methyltransferase Ste14